MITTGNVLEGSLVSRSSLEEAQEGLLLFGGRQLGAQGLDLEDLLEEYLPSSSGVREAYCSATLIASRKVFSVGF